MARLAVPYELYNTIKQRRAIGHMPTIRERRALYQAYLDTIAGRQAESERLAIEREQSQSLRDYRNRMLDLQEEQMKREAGAARIKGLVSIGELGFKGYEALKGTALGAKLGIGAVKPAISGTAASWATGGAQAQALMAPAGKAIVGGKIAEPVASSFAAAGEGAQTAVAGATETASTTTSSLVGSVLEPAGIGMAAGTVAHMLPVPEEAQRAIGGAAGAALGFAAGGPVGGIIGAIAGVFGGGCIIVTAATSPDSYEVQIARRYRDEYLDQQTLRGYYCIAEWIVPYMERSERVKKLVKKHLVDHLIKYGEYVFGIKKRCPIRSKLITKLFLKQCKFIGGMIPYYVRLNGEVW